jgi:hypothetical protein
MGDRGGFWGSLGIIIVLLAGSIIAYIIADNSTILKAKSVSVKKVPINGIWGACLEGVPDKYTVEPVKVEGSYDDYAFSVSLKFRVKQPYDGDMPFPADTFQIVPVTKNGVSGNIYSIDKSSVEDFNGLIQSPAGTTGIIRFQCARLERERNSTQLERKRNSWLSNSADMADRAYKAQIKAQIKDIRGFEGVTRTLRRRVAAVAPFTLTGKLPREANDTIRVGIMSQLGKNPRAKGLSFVDTTQIDRIMEQHKFETSDWSNGVKVAEVGKALNADVLITGTLIYVEEKYTLSVTILDINTMEVLGAISERDRRSLSDLFGNYGIKLNTLDLKL